jgi:putative FmdB family regulatory protein
MSPIFEYRCPNGHVTERLRKVEERDQPCPCIRCDSDGERIISAPHVLPDGVYSYAPNLGDAETFERKQAKMERTAEIKRDTGKTKLVKDEEI